MPLGNIIDEGSREYIQNNAAEIIKKKVLGKVGDAMADQAVEALMSGQTSPANVIETLSRMLPERQSADGHAALSPEAITKTFASQASNAGMSNLLPAPQQRAAVQPQAPANVNQQYAGRRPAKNQIGGVAVQNPQGILQRLFQQSGISFDEQGNPIYQTGGFFDLAAPNVEQELQTITDIQKISGSAPMSKATEQELNLRHRNRINEIMAGAMLKGAPMGEEQANAVAFSDDLANLAKVIVDLEKAGLTGPVKGRLPGFGGKNMALVAKFNAMAQSFFRSAAGYLYNETGRGFTEEDKKQLAPLLLASRSKFKSQTRGQLQAIVEKINSIFKREGLKKQIPNANIMMNRIKAGLPVFEDGVLTSSVSREKQQSQEKKQFQKKFNSGRYSVEILD